MNHYFLESTLIIVLIIILSCHGNRMKTNEKVLTKQILTEEEQLAHHAEMREGQEKQLADSIAKLPKGFRFKDRRIDPENPPVVIDIAGNRTNPQKIKLSQLFSKVEYIRLEQNPDSAEILRGTQYIVAPNHIYTTSGKGGIFQYDREGNLTRTVCAGNLQFTNFKGVVMVTKEQADLFEGAQGVYLNENKLCYTYENRPASKAYLITFDDRKEPGISNLQLPGSVEDETQINGNGNILTELKKDPSDYEFPTPFVVGENTIAFAQRRKPVKKAVNFISVLSTTGDTLCEFKDYDPIRNYTKSLFRGVDDGNSYYFNGILHLRQAFNDTIYQMFPPNRLIPKYILDFGGKGIASANEGIDPGFNLKDKLIPQSFLETNRYLFITYSKDYDCPNTAKAGTLKYSRLIYDKMNKSITTVYLDEVAYLPEGKMTWPSAPNINIENDLDGIPYLWPNSVTANGNPFSTMTGKDLLKLKSETLPVKNIRDNDRIIAIYH
jgi:hypothetical protein